LLAVVANAAKLLQDNMTSLKQSLPGNRLVLGIALDD
jgi:hypothetical protein